MKIAINIFDGEAPKITPRLLKESQAQVAKNCQLDQGSLQGFNDLSDEFTLALYKAGSGGISTDGVEVNGRNAGSGKYGQHKYGTGKYGAGIGTAFLSEVNLGDMFRAGGQERTVVSVESDIALTVDEAFSPDLPADTPYSYGSSGTQPKTIYKLNNIFWIAFNSKVNVVMASSENADDRFFYTDAAKPRCSNYALASNNGADEFGSPATSYYLGIPSPGAALVATKKGGADPAPAERTATLVTSASYVYTFVNSWGFEGPPSVPSNNLDIYPGQYVELSHFELTLPGNYNIAGFRIYRVNTADNTAEYQLVEDILGASGEYVTPAEIRANDDVWEDSDGMGELTLNLQEVLPSENWTPIPDYAEGLIGLSNGVYAVFVGKNVYLSEPGVPNAYPLDYMRTADVDVMALGYYGTTIVVVTSAYIYLLEAYDPQAASWIRKPIKQACVSKRGMVNGTDFCLYPSPDGLVMVSASGIVLLTKDMFTKEQWQALNPGDIIGFLYDQKYYAFIEGTNQGFIIDFDSSSRQHYVSFSLAEGYQVWGGYVDPETDSLFLLVCIGGVYFIKKWEGATTKFTYHWKSKKFKLPYQVSFSAAFIKANFVNGVIFRVYKNGQLQVEKTAVSPAPFRIRTGLGDEYEIELSGDDEIFEVGMAPSMGELM